MTDRAPQAFLAYLTQPSPDVCILNLQIDREGQFIRCEIAKGDQYAWLVKLAEMAGQHNRREMAQ